MGKRFLNPGVIFVIALVVVAGIGLWSLSHSAKTERGSAIPVVVAWSPFESSGLFLVADEKQFFTENGLNLTLYRSDSGAAALDDMLAGKTDIAVSVSEYPFVRKVFGGTPARAVACMDKADYIFVVARKDRGIAIPEDLKGKRIGTAAGSIAEFHLGRFLSLHGLGINDVRYVSGKMPPETTDDVVNGNLDAAVLAQPYADLARVRLGENGIVWPAQNRQPLYALVVSTEGWIAGHPEETARFIRALAEAEDYMNAHPAEAGAIVQRRLMLDPAYMDAVRRQNQFSLTLDQSLVTAMEDESRWMIANNLTNVTEIPDFRSYLYTDGLESVRPGSVNIIG
jgi:ABC-type nitrate/sulfonate/bicarbonate transport system substrate-binding protein